MVQWGKGRGEERSLEEYVEECGWGTKEMAAAGISGWRESGRGEGREDGMVKGEEKPW